VYERILVPVEGTETDDPILDHVRELALIHGSEVILLRVAHYHTRDERSHEMDDARLSLEAAETRLQEAGVRVRAELVPGEPGEAIIQMVEELQPDLVAMATHGHGRISRAVLGSVAEKVRHAIHVPLLLVKAPPQE